MGNPDVVRIPTTRRLVLSLVTVALLVVAPLSAMVPYLLERTAAPYPSALMPLAKPPAVSIEELPPLSVNEAQSKVPFPIPQPGWLPSGLVLRGVYVGAPHSLSIAYVPAAAPASDAPGKAGLSITVMTEDSRGTIALGGAESRPVFVNGNKGRYWVVEGKDLTMLSWTAGGLRYAVLSSGLGLTQNELLRIAESLR